MFVPLRIGPSPTPQPPADAIAMLEDCHERIRTFSALAMALAWSEAEGGEAKCRDAAARLIRYFELALPLHTDDEDLTLAPRLLSRPAPAEVVVELETMTREHDEIEALLEILMPQWKAFASGTVTAESLAKLQLETVSLAEHFKTHLKREERVIFPYARRVLDAAAMKAMAEEIRARRL